MACVAKQYGLTRPIIGDGIIISQGRHLLQEMFVPSFIPNDFCPESKKVTILTGPNSSGKSVFMKQLGLIQYMGQIGGFVPAEMAQIVLVDKLLTRMNTKDASVSGESTFSFELRQMKNALEAATGNSLLLIDEFGKGTSPEDGIALLAALVKYLMELPEEERPWVLIITHFREVYQLLAEHEEHINWLWMQVTVGEDQVTYQYRATLGKSESSLALQCAKKAGIPQSILKRAKELESIVESGTLLYEVQRDGKVN